MKHVIDGVSLVPGNDLCESVSLRSVLNFHGYDDLDGTLASHWYFRYEGFDEQGGMSITALPGSRYSGLERAGMELAVADSDDFDEAWQVTRNEVARDRPVVVWVDESALPFWNTKESSIHSIVLYGFEDGKHVWVADGWAYIVYNDVIDFDAFRVARVSLNPANAVHPLSSGYPIKNRYLTITPPAVRPESRELAIAYASASLEAVETSDPERTGPRGITTMATALRELVDSGADGQQLSTALERAFVTSFNVTLQRKYARSLLSNLPHHDDLEALATSIHREWAITRSLMFKASKKPEKRLINSVADRLSTLSEMEERVFNAFGDVPAS